MVLATAILLLQFSAFPGTSNPAHPSPGPNPAAHPAKSSPDSKKAFPGVTAPADGLTTSEAVPEGVSQPPRPNEITASASLSEIYLPPPPAFRPKIEPVERTNRLWFALTAAEHGTASFDAWSTRRAVSQG
ncbi:MAG TPA: hypothetical protein VGU63_06315, partial [Candidatus Acidoferrales bacterium]|nr:hypothetical protein [Candidatus Acidoferrales bacterium]